MQLLAPMMMIGAAAVSIPIALHFFYRARYKPLPWAPMKFLKEAIEQTSRRLKFQEWILLALRCLIILLLALAIARPALDSATTAGRGEALDAVLVFDTSFSMDARDEDNKTRLDKAKKAALAVLNTLPASSSVQIIGCSRADKAPVIGPTNRFNIDQARQVIADIETTSLATDLLPGLDMAFEVAQKGTAPAKEIYVFTDMQRTGFETQQSMVKAKCEEIKGKANLIFVRCGTEALARKTRNVAILDVTTGGTLPHTKTTISFDITVKNTSVEPAKGVIVSLDLDGQRNQVQVDLDAGQTRAITLAANLEQAGLRVVTVEARNDDIPGDNVIYRTIFVREKVRVLLVDGHPNPNDPTEAGDHYVRTGLIPDAAAAEFMDVETVTATEASRRDLANRDIVYLLGAPVRGPDPTVGMSADFLAALNEFVRDGGGLVIASGDLVNAELYNKTLGSEGKGYGLLPYNLKELRLPDGRIENGIRNATETSPFYPAANSAEEASFLGPFRKSPYSDALQRVAIQRMYEVEEAGSASRVLVRTTDGKPYLCSKVVGAGEVVFVAGSLDQRWGNFSSDPGSFQIPFTNFTVAHLTRSQVAGGTLTAGVPLVWFPPGNDDKTEYELVKPSVGLLVTKVLKGDRAAMAGFEVDDVIVSVAGEPVRTTNGLSLALGAIKPNVPTEVVVLRKGEKQKLSVDPPALVDLSYTVKESRPRVKLDIPAPAEGQKRTATSTDTARAGVYHIVPIGKREDRENEKKLVEAEDPVFTVNPDLRESANLTVADDANVESWLGFKPHLVEAGNDTESTVTSIRTRSEWTEYVLVILLVFLVGESIWAWVCGRAW